jgi:hypothetical protein
MTLSPQQLRQAAQNTRQRPRNRAPAIYIARRNSQIIVVRQGGPNYEQAKK